MARGKGWRCYTFRRCSSPFVVEVSCLPTEFGGGGWWIFRNGDEGLDRSFETSQRTPKTESGIKRYGQNDFWKFQFSGRSAWPGWGSPGLSQAGFIGWVAGLAGLRPSLRLGWLLQVAQTHKSVILMKKLPEKPQIEGEINEIWLWERKGSKIN